MGVPGPNLSGTATLDAGSQHLEQGTGPDRPGAAAVGWVYFEAPHQVTAPGAGSPAQPHGTGTVEAAAVG